MNYTDAAHVKQMDYSRIHNNRGERISPISQSILNQFPWNFTHTHYFPVMSWLPWTFREVLISI